METNEERLCECGCGWPTTISDVDRPEMGYVKGMPRRFIHGHNLGRLQFRNTTHGQRVGGRATPEYSSYRAAMDRCTNPKNPDWQYYGGRGIQFRFTRFSTFYNELGPRPDGTVSSVEKVALGFGGNLASIKPGPIQRADNKGTNYGLEYVVGYPGHGEGNNGTDGPDVHYDAQPKDEVLKKLFGGTKK